jgi:quercetin dioxygenase-like cupin family protein
MRTMPTFSCALLAIVLSMAGPAVAHDADSAVVALDNPSVLVSLVTLAAGTSTGIHMNPEPELIIVAEGELVLVTRHGKEVLKAGRVVFLRAGTGHEGRNESAQPVKLWATNLKKCE